MKKVLLSLSLVASLFAKDTLLPKQEVIDMIKHSPIANNVNFKKDNIKGTFKDNFFIISINGKIFYKSADKKYSIFGTIIDENRKPLLPDFPITKTDTIKDGIVFTFGSGNKDLYVVTDPECPWCRKFEESAKNDKSFSKKYKIHVIFLPLSFHKNAKNMIYYILSAPTKEEQIKRFHSTLGGDESWKNFKPTAKQKKHIDKIIKKSEKAAVELGAAGTPSFYDNKFNQLDPNKLINKAK